MSTKREIHILSGRWDRSPRLLINAIIRSKRLGAFIILLTECADGKRDDALSKLNKSTGVGVLQQRKPWDRGEVAIAYDKRLGVVWWKNILLAKHHGPGLPAQCIIGVFDDPETDLRYLSAMSHMMSGVEADLARGRKSYRTGVWFTTAWAYRRAVRAAIKEHRPDLSTVGADWNIDLLKPWARVLIKTILPGHVTLIDTTGHKDTHGNRQIDGFLIRVFRKARRLLKKRMTVEVLPPHPHSDHDGLALTFWTKR